MTNVEKAYEKAEKEIARMIPAPAPAKEVESVWSQLQDARELVKDLEHRLLAIQNALYGRNK